MADLSDDTTYKWLSWMRFCEYEGDMMTLIQAKMRDEKNNKQESSESDDAQPSCWKAENLGVISRENEKRVLAHIKKLCVEALKKYQHSMQQDITILAEDDKDQKLSFNLRNCVLFRLGEKEILHFYIEFADYMTSLLDMKFRDAKKET